MMDGNIYPQENQPDLRTFSVYFIACDLEIEEIEGLDVIKYNKFKNRHNASSDQDAIQIIVDHLSAKQIKLSKGLRYLYKSVDGVDFDLILEDDNPRYKKLRILNVSKKYAFDYTINNFDDYLKREGRINDIPVQLYVKAKYCDSMFYSLLLNDFKIHNTVPDVEMKTLHYSFDEVDYEVCDLDKVRKNDLKLLENKQLIEQGDTTLPLQNAPTKIEDNGSQEQLPAENIEAPIRNLEHVADNSTSLNLIDVVNDVDQSKIQGKSLPANKEQKEFMISYMVQHTNFAKNRINSLGVLGDKTKDLMWQNLGSELNKLGPHKTPTQWKSYWNTLKLGAKSATVKFSKVITETGGSKKRPKPPTSDQEQINGLFGNFGFGHVYQQEIGFKKIQNKENLNIKPPSKPRKPKCIATDEIPENLALPTTKLTNSFLESLLQWQESLSNTSRILDAGFEKLCSHIKFN